VHGALLGYRIGVARRASWPRERIEELTSLVASVRSLTEEDPLAAPTHVALAGLLTAAHFALERLEPLWATTDPATRERWVRDRMILSVAGKARQARREAAWQRLTSE
jgi:acyl-CoA dehydrogenase